MTWEGKESRKFSKLQPLSQSRNSQPSRLEGADLTWDTILELSGPYVWLYEFKNSICAA